ncbi:MAG: tetratricopeptide repeat protein [Planctomycetes bacterium]|nr:tetratricopeptide repeat protein [Planctomycetota bacterium]
MNVRKEQVVFAVTVLVVGAFVATAASETALRRPSSAAAKAVELVDRPAPDVAYSLPVKRELAAFDRDLFSQPRDTRPLPPLDLEAPPVAPLAGLFPPPLPGPAPAHFGALLRTQAAPTRVDGLFVAEGEGGAATTDDEDGGAVAELTAAAKNVAKKLSPDEVAAQIESWKRLYDWIRINEGRPLFGYIRNEDRFGLHLATNEPVLFIEVDPESGREKFPGQPPSKFERARVLEFALAASFDNQIQIRRRELGKSISSGQYTMVLAFADECVRRRGEARRALEVAEEMYKLAQTQSADDPAPRLGLARCYEAGFDFDHAFEVYQSLLDGGFAHRPEVHARLAELEARFRLFDSAETRLREAERLARGDGAVAWTFGRFLMDRGRFAEALERLKNAYKFEPTGEDKSVRAAIRYDLGRAYCALGELTQARDLFEKSLQADASFARARAGLSAVDLLLKKPTSAITIERDRASFEELYDHALADLAAKKWTAARDGLLLAADADPLRAQVAWSALSWLCEITGYPEEALRWIEDAWAADPTDAWICWQRGRLLAEREDLDGARDMYQSALDLDLDFVDALVALGDLSARRGEREAADKYFERALMLEPSRAEVHALRGWNLLFSGDVRGAQDAFKKGTEYARGDASCGLGLAWCTYRTGAVESTLQQFADVEDGRRSAPEDDPLRIYARRQISRISDHATKVIWTDRFERRMLRNDWVTEEAAGPTVALVDGQLVLRGNFTENGATRVWKPWQPTLFYAIDLDVSIANESKTRVGVFLAKERPIRAGGVQTLGKIAVARHMEGGLQVLTLDRTDNQENWTDVPPVGGVAWWPTDKPVHIHIERVGEGSDAKGRITVDGITVAEGFRMTALAATNQDLRVGVFAEGATGRPVRVEIDNVEVVYRASK